MRTLWETMPGSGSRSWREGREMAAASLARVGRAGPGGATHHVRGQGHPAPAWDADRQLHTNHHHRHIFGRIKEICILLIGLTGFGKNLFMGLLAPASASQPANKRQMSAKTFAKLACQLLISWRRNTGCIQSPGPVSPEFDKSSSPADLAQGRQGRHRG